MRELTSNESLSYGSPPTRAMRLERRPPRLHASQPGSTKSKSMISNLGKVSRGFLKCGRQTEDVTSESRMPESFRRATCNGTEKYSAVIKLWFQYAGLIT